jgi:hypothetical protein
MMNACDFLRTLGIEPTEDGCRIVEEEFAAAILQARRETRPSRRKGASKRPVPAEAISADLLEEARELLRIIDDANAEGLAWSAEKELKLRRTIARRLEALQLQTEQRANRNAILDHSPLPEAFPV